MNNQAQPIASRGFILELPGIVSEIITSVAVWHPVKDQNDLTGDIHPVEVSALWDTGATHSAITSRLINKLNLKSIKPVKVKYGNGLAESNLYAVSLFLPTKFVMPFVRVTECVEDEDKFDIIIGMDVITQGDFILTHLDGKTKFVFRMPSIGVEEINTNMMSNHSGQNTKPISGKKELDAKMREKNLEKIREKAAREKK